MCMNMHVHAHTPTQQTASPHLYIYTSVYRIYACKTDVHITHSSQFH